MGSKVSLEEVNAAMKVMQSFIDESLQPEERESDVEAPESSEASESAPE